MRVISGIYKGRQLASFKAEHIRPTTDRVKETLFNIIGSEISSARVLDLFSGTGNLGIEALSRGASYVECVEVNKRSIAIIRKNLDLLKITSQMKVVAQDVFKYLKTYKGDSFDVVLIDPPFTEKWADKSLAAISTSSVLGSQTLIVIESSRHEMLNNVYGRLSLLDRRDFGDKSASFFRVINSD